MPVIPQTIPFTIGGGGGSITVATGIATETDTAHTATPVMLTTPGGTNYLADVTVEIAFDSGHRTPAASRTWTDVSSYVEATQGITITRGRQDEQSKVSPGSLALVLDNRDGRFTPGNTGSPHYPNVLIGRPIRVRATVGGTPYDRIVAYIDSWDVSWDGGTDEASTVAVAATSRMGRLGRGAEMRALLLEELAVDEPAAWWRLSEPAGSTSAADHSGNGRPSLRQTRTGAAITFGVEAGSPSTDGLTAARFASGAGRFLTAQTGFGSGLAGMTLECFASSTSTDTSMIFEAYTDPDATGPYVYLYWNNGTVWAAANGDTGAATLVSSPSTYKDGQVHHLAARVTQTLLELYVDGVMVASQGYTSRTFGASYVAVGDSVLRDALGEPAFDGVVAHACVHTVALDAARILSHAQAGRDGGVGETPGARVARYAHLAGIPAVEVSAAAGQAPMAHVDTAGVTVVDLLGRVEDTDGGLVLDGKDGTLVYQARSHRYNTASAFTLNGQLHQLEASATAALDTERVINQVDASLASGGFTYRAQDAASVEAYGVFGASVEVSSTSEDEAVQAALVRVNRQAEPRLRAPGFDVDLTAQTSMAAILAADVGSRFTVTNGPAQAPALAAVYVIEGYTESITGDSHRMSINASSAAPLDVWQLEHATFGVLDGGYFLAY